MESIKNVWYNDDLRREIFSYLRKEPKVKCEQCNGQRFNRDTLQIKLLAKYIIYLTKNPILI